MKKILTIFLIFILSTNVIASTIKDLEAELDRIKNEQKQNAEKLNGIEKQMAQYIYEMTVLDEQMIKYSDEYDKLMTKYNDINENIKDYEKRLNEAANLYDNMEEVYITRMKILYENGIPSMFEVMLTSNSISDFFNKWSVVESIIEYDKGLINNMDLQKEYIDAIKKDLEVQVTKLEQIKFDTEKTMEYIEASIESKKAKQEELKKSEALLKAASKDLANDEEKAQREIQAELDKLASSGIFTGEFLWPVPVTGHVSSPYGNRWHPIFHKYMFHYGIDIPAWTGNKVVAAASGKVVVATYHRSYGYYVVIDHGKSEIDGATYRTLYAHNSVLNDKVGDSVARGQVISKIGTTGNSTGPHLHFEVHRNGKTQNPLNYVKY